MLFAWKLNARNNFITFRLLVLNRTNSSPLKRKLKIFLKCLLVFWVSPVVINAQILKDTTSLNLVKESIENIYNLRFSYASEACKKLRQLYPEHPVNYLLEGMITYWKNYPLPPSSSACVSFENELRNCITLSERKNSKEDEAEYLLANLSARGFLLLFYSDNNLTMDVIPLAASTYQYIRRSFNYTSVQIDFFFFTGLYNYSREAFPEAYPVYKPLAMLFPKGDKYGGLKELQTAAKSSIFFKAEASSFLSGLYLSFENNYEESYNYSKWLHELYPSNFQYLAIHIRSLLLTKRYDEAEKVMESSGTNIPNHFYKAQLSIFKGILQEKKYHNDKLAEKFYISGVKDISLFGYFSNEFAAYGYFGLSRISGRKGDSNLRKTYRKKALELADFKDVNFD
jgi:hypothetical protein